MPRLSAHDIHNKEFKRTLRGYDMNEVNDFLDLIIKDYIEYENAIQGQSSNRDGEQLGHITDLLEQLMYDIQQLREENRLLREKLERPIPTMQTHPMHPQPLQHQKQLSPYPQQPYYR